MPMSTMPMTGTNRFALGMLAIAAVVAATFAPARAQAPRMPVSAVVIGISVSIWPAIVADRKGFFAAEGLDLDLINSGSSARSLQQVAAGSAQIGSSSMTDSVRAIGGGADVRVFLNSLAVGTHSLVAAKSITSVAGLKGKRVMTGGTGDITNLWWYALARHFNLDPARDVDLLFSGSTAARTAALFGGAIDATLLSTPQSFKAIDAGFTDLGPVAPYLGEFPVMIWHANARWARANAATLAAFIRAHNRAVRYMADPTNRQEVSDILAKASGSSLEDALKTWDLCMRINAFVADGAIGENAVARVRDTLTDAGDLKGPPQPAAAFYDRRYVDAVAREGK
jgi:NitT/TauT family transport system substrate-binding protein